MDVTVMAAQLLGPLQLAVDNRSHLWRLLHQLAAATDVDDTLYQRFGGMLPVDDLRAIDELFAALADPDDPRSPGDIIGALIPLVQSVLDAVRALTSLSQSNVDDLIAPMDAAATWRKLAELLPGYLLGRFLGDAHPVLAAMLGLLGTLERVDLPDGDGYDLADFGALGNLLADPAGHVRSTYRWGGDFDYPALVDRVAALATAIGHAVRRTTGDDGYDRLDLSMLDVIAAGEYQRVVLALAPAPDGTGRPEGLAITIGSEGTLAGVPMAESWTLSAGGPIDGAIVELRPGGTTLAGPPAALMIAGAPATPWALLGSPTGTRLELASASLEATADGGDLGVTARLGDPGSGTGLRLVVGVGGADSFLAALLGGDLAVDTSLSIVWSARDGVSFGGAASLSVDLIVERTIGPVTVHRVTVAVTAAEGQVELLLIVACSGEIGPVAVAVDGVGMRAMLTPAADGGIGLLGAYDLSVGFQPPAGAGLAIDAGVATGGGYLYLDPAAGAYAGVLDLQILAVGVNAIAIVDTTAPGGWSLFFALFLSLPSIQLGFGFTLTGVGGLVGIDRTLDTRALGAAVRGGALDAALFPDDPVADAPYLIDQFRAMFPASPGRYTFGPVIRLGWGTPSLIEAEVGVVISLPDPITIAVIGALSSVLPTEQIDVVALHLDVDGTADFGSAALSIDASLHDSYVLGFALSGDMALRASFGDHPDFLMALGGFHPHFTPTMPFPKLARLSLAVSAAPTFQISFDCYFAVGSNTVQFGAAFSLSAEIEGFGVEGGSEFDALITFSPFAMRTDLGFHISVTAAGLDLAGVWLDARLTGPNPWYVTGSATFKVLGVAEHLNVDQRIGTARDEAGAGAVDLRDEMRTALGLPEAWSAIDSPASGVLLAAPATDEPGAELLAMPDGVVTVGQRVAPLGIRLDKAGDAPIGAYHTFDLTPADAAAIQTATVRDWFAPGYYFELDGAESLASPSFEQLPSGIEFGGGDPVAGVARAGSLAYEQILRDPVLAGDRVIGTYDLATDGRPAVVAVGVPGVGGPGFCVAPDPDAVGLARTTYAVTRSDTGRRVAGAASFSAARFGDAGRRSTSVVAPSWEPVPSRAARDEAGAPGHPLPHRPQPHPPQPHPPRPDLPREAR